MTCPAKHNRPHEAAAGQAAPCPSNNGNLAQPGSSSTAAGAPSRVGVLNQASVKQRAWSGFVPTGSNSPRRTPRQAQKRRDKSQTWQVSTGLSLPRFTVPPSGSNRASTGSSPEGSNCPRREPAKAHRRICTTQGRASNLFRLTACAGRFAQFCRFAKTRRSFSYLAKPTEDDATEIHSRC